MTKLYVTLLVLALAIMPALAQVDLRPTTNSGDPALGDGFGASLEVSITVNEWAEVTWAEASLGLEIEGPVAWEKGHNWDIVPLNVKSNSDVTLTVIEGIGDWLVSQGIPSQGIWGHRTGSPWNWGELIYATTLQLFPKADGYKSESEPWGAVYDYAGGTVPWVDPIALPEDTGDYSKGGYGLVWLDYATKKATGPQGPAGYSGGVDWNGDITIYPGIGLVAQPGSIGGVGWWSLPAETKGTPKVYAVVSAFLP